MPYDIRTCSTHPNAAHRVLPFADDSNQAAEVECLKCRTLIPQGPIEPVGDNGEEGR